MGPLEPYEALRSAGPRESDLGEPAVVVLSYMNPDSLGFWNFPPEGAARRDPLQATRSDEVATSLADAARTVAAGVASDSAKLVDEEPLRIAKSLRALQWARAQSYCAHRARGR